jgi:hypothetical protein
LIWKDCPELPESFSSTNRTGRELELLSELPILNITQPSLPSHHDMDLLDDEQQTTSSTAIIVTDREPASAGFGRTIEPEGLMMDLPTNLLKKRGIGKYYCHYGLSCSKGGVTSSGSVKEFTRNSDFR